jgi:Repeat of Unknown Function (DUF347)
VPAITVTFWIIKIAATTLGETGGDSVTMTIGLGYPIGSLIFFAALALFVAILVAVWGGVPRRGIYDNMKTAVDRVKSGKPRKVHTRFAALSSHYLLEPQFCSPPPVGRRARFRRTSRYASTHIARK